jgi:DNA polymerase-3 subunit chi
VVEIGFYHLQSTTLDRALPGLLGKAVKSGLRAVVLAGSVERVEALDAALWTFDPDSFLPHGTEAAGSAAEQPIWLTKADENPNGAALLVLVDDMDSAKLADYQRIAYMFDGNDGAAVAAARARWTLYKAQGHALVYWQQGESGGWEKKS